MDYATMLPVFFRGSERLLIVAAAALCIVLGYKLFKIVPSHRESEGKFTLGDLSVTLAKIGPGVFFSLFGAFVLYQSVQSTLDIGVPPPSQTANSSGQQSAAAVQPYRMNWMGTTDAETTVWAARASGPIKILNCLAKKAGGTKVELRRIEDAIHTAKVAIIADVWLPEWGDSSAFGQLNMGNIVRKSPIGEIYYALDEDC